MIEALIVAGLVGAAVLMPKRDLYRTSAKCTDDIANTVTKWFYPKDAALLDAVTDMKQNHIAPLRERGFDWAAGFKASDKQARSVFGKGGR